MTAPTRRDGFDRALRSCREAVPPGPGPHPLVVAPGEDRLAALLRLIAGTILPRRMLLDGAAGLGLTLDLARGRVLAIGPGPAAEGPEADGGDGMQPVTREDAVAVLARLVRIAEGPLQLRRARLAVVPEGPGIPVPLLADLHRRPPPDPAQVLARFLAAIDPGDAALLRFEAGEVVQVEGGEEALGPLVDFAASLRDTLLAPGDAGGTARFILLLSGPGGTARHATLLVIAAESRVLLRFLAELAGPVIALWRSCQQQG